MNSISLFSAQARCLRQQGILESKLVPTEMNIYNNDDYDAFYKERASIVFNKINELSDQ